MKETKMRKADKRKRGEERAQAYLAETKETGLAAQRLDNQLRAERARLKAIDKKKPKNVKVINSIHRDEHAYEEVN
jgi:hypothetical protein